jgi:hypothetical protein
MADPTQLDQQLMLMYLEYLAVLMIGQIHFGIHQEIEFVLPFYIIVFENFNRIDLIINI